MLSASVVDGRVAKSPTPALYSAPGAERGERLAQLALRVRRKDYLPKLLRDDPEMLDLTLGALFRYDPRMAVHAIALPDVLRGGEPRTILWDDAAGTVSGTHTALAGIRDAFDAPKPVEAGVAGQVWRLRDPARDPAEFLVLLYIAHWPALFPPLRETLPAIFDGVEMPPGEPDEELFDGRGRRIV